MICDYCEHEHTPELAKSLVTCVEAAELLGFEPDRGSKIPSFANPDERTPSLHVYDGDGGWHDYSAGEGGDVIDFVMRATGYEFNKALSQLIHRSLKAGREPGDVERQPVRQVKDFTEELGDFPLLTDHPLNRHPFGSLDAPPNCRMDFDCNLLIPHCDSEGCYGVKIRHPDGRKEAWPGSQFTKAPYSPEGRHDQRHAACVLAEGESDCWWLASALPEADHYALPSGASSWKDSWKEVFHQYETVWVCTDNDHTGEAARSKLERKIGFLYVRHLRVPQLINDAREAGARGWVPELR